RTVTKKFWRQSPALVACLPYQHVTTYQDKITHYQHSPPVSASDTFYSGIKKLNFFKLLLGFLS
ncbi:hypothetical protein, partial [Aliikangiella maris]